MVRCYCSQSRQPYSRSRARRILNMIVALELTFVGLLVLAVLAIAFVSLTVLVNLFKGQR